MFGFVLFFIFNIIYSSLPPIFRPMSEREIDFDGDVCHYTHVHNTESGGSTQTIEYVKGCKKGKRCRPATNNIENYEIKTCQEYDELELLTLGEKCEYTSQCDSGLTCKDDVCTVTENNPAYEKDGYYYCPSDLIPISTTEYSYACIKQSIYKDYSTSRCYYDDEEGNKIYSAPEFLKVCGEIKFYKLDSTSNYEYIIKQISTTSIGSQPDGTYVHSPIACESGFTLKYYPENQINKKDTKDQSVKYRRCATINEVDIYNNIIKYSLDNKEYTVRYSQVKDNVEIEHIKIKLDMFKKFKDKMDKCKSEKYKTFLKCEDRDVQEYLYFYNNPEHYILYKDENQVMDYLLNGQYNSFSFIILLFFLFLI